MKLWNELKSRMLAHPGRTVGEGNAKMTFEDLVIHTEAKAQKLRGLRCCAILCDSEMAAGMALLACFAAQVTAVPLSRRYGVSHFRRILGCIGPDALLSDGEDIFTVTPVPDPTYRPPEKHPAVIMCTSGTTGTPKGVMLSEDNLLANLRDIAAYFGPGEDDTILIARPLYHGAVLTGEFLAALWGGADIRFAGGACDPSALLRLIDRTRATVFGGTPTLLCMMARFRRGEQAGSLRRIAVSGECMSRAAGQKLAVAFPQAEIFHVYGLTEAAPRVAFLPPALFGEFPDCVGRPLRSVSVRIVGQDGKPVPQGEEGTLLVRGPNVMLGYYNDPAATRRVLRGGWLDTGDTARMNEAGLLQIRGRRDDLIIRAGMNIYPAEIENALQTDRRVREAVAYGFLSPTGQTQIGLKIAGDFADEAEIRALCGRVLPAYEIPCRIEWLPSLARNGSGKLVRRAPQ